MATEIDKLRAVAGATVEYLRAHSTLVCAGTTPERPEAAKRLADAWIAMNKAATEIPAGATLPEHMRSGMPGPHANCEHEHRVCVAVTEPTHAYVPGYWAEHQCDAKIDDDGRVRTCGDPADAAVHQVAATPAKKSKAKRR